MADLSSKRTLTPRELAEMQSWWESTVGSATSKAKTLAHEYGVHPNTVSSRARRDGWHNPTEGEEAAIEAVEAAAAEAAPDWLDIEDRMALETQILELKRELAASKSAVDRLRPDVDIEDRLYVNVAEVVAFFGPERLAEVAMNEIAQTNKERMRRGFPSLSAAEMQVSDAQIETEARKILMDRRNAVPTSGPLDRKIKMIAPVKDGCVFDDDGNPTNCYKHGSLRNIPFEAHINNLRGSMYDATQRYLEKGFKLTKPYLCMGGDCTEPAVVDARGKFVYNGYCSEAHRSRTPAEKQGNEQRQILATVGAAR